MRELLLVVGLVALVGYGGTVPGVDAAQECQVFPRYYPPGSTFRVFGEYMISNEPGDGLRIDLP